MAVTTEEAVQSLTDAVIERPVEDISDHGDPLDDSSPLLRQDQQQPDPESSLSSSPPPPCKESLDKFLSRPILVGYAFGPKKMSTMGVVMAEASKTNLLSSVSTTVLVEEDDEDDAEGSSSADDHQPEEEHKITVVCSGNDDEELVQDAIAPAWAEHRQQQQEEMIQGSAEEDERAIGIAAAESPASTTNNNLRSSSRRKSQDTNTNSNNNNANIVLSLDSYSGGLQNIVRYLHSSCSSVDTNSTTTTLLTTGTTLTGVTPSSANSASGRMAGAGGASICSGRSSNAAASCKEQQQQRLRVSFVPLDPDLPLEGQHGAKMDIILHKLTEDILCLSKFSPMYPEIVPNLGSVDGRNSHRLERLLDEVCPRLSNEDKAAILRVHRLMQYQKKHPDCSLADDPAKVLTLMSRSDIAHALADCLVGVTSASGIPVSSPKFVVWQPPRPPPPPPPPPLTTAPASAAEVEENDPSNSRSASLAASGLLNDNGIRERCYNNLDHTGTIAQRLRDANMSYPLIAKPLQAAGTKISHYMTVLLQESSLDHIQNSFCLLQEYANHDAVLYKVYVLGNNVHVFQRTSLPNLPRNLGDSSGHEKGEEEGASQRQGTKQWCCGGGGPTYVDFDSQRPYPRLSAFGVLEDGKQPSHHPTTNCMMRTPPPYLSSLSSHNNNKPAAAASSATTKTSTDIAVTVEEVQPIVNTLKKAFGLELFGFDILITSSGGDDEDTKSTGMDDGRVTDATASTRKMLVVDVNYFPSYKEVLNFPSLLAQYLTQRAIDSRRKPHEEHGCD